MGLAGDSQRQLFEKTSSFLSIAKKVGPDRVIAPLSGVQEPFAQACFPRGVLVVAIQVSFKTLEIFMDQWGINGSDISINNKSFVNFHVLGICRFIHEMFKTGCAFFE